MFCPRCGTQNEVGAANCLRCGSALPQPQAATPSESSAAPPASGNIASGEVPSSAEETFLGGSSSPIDTPNYPGPPGQSPYPSAPQYGGGQAGGAPQGYGAPYGSGGQAPYGGSGQAPYGGQPGYGAGGGQSPYGSTPSYGSGPGYGGGGTPPGGDVPNYLVWSILTTLLCCLPIGVVAIVYSTQVNSKLQVGDYAGALEASNKAKLWCMISAGLGVAISVIYILAVIIGAAAR